jgi:hypothetical protein
MKYLIIHTGQPKEAKKIKDTIILENPDSHGKVFGLKDLYNDSILTEVNSSNLVVLLHPGEPEMFLACWTEAKFNKYKDGQLLIILNKDPWFCLSKKYVTIVKSIEKAITYLMGTGDA